MDHEKFTAGYCKFRVFSFGFFQDENIEVGILPQREEVVVGLGALGGRSFKRVRAAGAMRAAY